jgi:hypothetical protein
MKMASNRSMRDSRMTASPPLIGVGAGIVAAALFASLAKNSALAFLLFYLTPLPVLLAGIGWGTRAGALALLTSAALLGLILSVETAIAFSMLVGVPGLIISYLMQLRRVFEGAPGEAQTRVEWFPFGWVIAWTSVMAGVLVGFGLMLISGDLASYQQAMRAVFQEATVKQLEQILGTGLNQTDLDRFADRFSLYILPFFGAMSWLLVMVANLWLATRSAAISGLLARPLPVFAHITYPPLMLVGFGLALAASFLPGMFGVAGTAFLGALNCAFLILGAAVVHVLLAGSPFRPGFLALMYVGLVVMHWLVAPPLTLLGLAEMFFHLRQRHWQRMTPPGSDPGPTL